MCLDSANPWRNDGLTWLYPVVAKAKADTRPIPNWSEVHQELKRSGFTLLLLWQEYKAIHPDGLQYSQFCDRYRYFA